MLVTQTQEKTQQDANTHVQHVVNTVKWRSPRSSSRQCRNPVIQEKIGRIVLRGEFVKDDSGAYAVFTEQGSSASQNDTGKGNGRYRETTLIVHDKPPTQYLFTPKSKWRTSLNVQIHGDVFHDTNGQNHASGVDDPVVLLERFLYGHPLAGLLYNFEEVLLGT